MSQQSYSRLEAISLCCQRVHSTDQPAPYMTTRTMRLPRWSGATATLQKDLPDNNSMCSYTKPLTTIISSGCHATVIFISHQGYSWILPAILLKATTSKIWMSLLLITLMIVFSKSMYFPVTRVNLCVFPFTRGNSCIFMKNMKILTLWAPWVTYVKNFAVRYSTANRGPLCEIEQNLKEFKH